MRVRVELVAAELRRHVVVRTVERTPQPRLLCEGKVERVLFCQIAEATEVGVPPCDPLVCETGEGGSEVRSPHPLGMQQRDAAVDPHTVGHAEPTSGEHLVVLALQAVVVTVALVRRHRYEVRWAEAIELLPQQQRVADYKYVTVDCDEAGGSGEELRPEEFEK